MISTGFNLIGLLITLLGVELSMVTLYLLLSVVVIATIRNKYLILRDISYIIQSFTKYTMFIVVMFQKLLQIQTQPQHANINQFLLSNLIKPDHCIRPLREFCGVIHSAFFGWYKKQIDTLKENKYIIGNICFQVMIDRKV